MSFESPGVNTAPAPFNRTDMIRMESRRWQHRSCRGTRAQALRRGARTDSDRVCPSIGRTESDRQRHRRASGGGPAHPGNPRVRYTESKEKSAELLRVALATMGRHEAAFNPLTFAVWYEHAAGTNPRLSRAIERAVAESALIDNDLIAKLHRDHISGIDETAMQRAYGQFQQVIASMAESATRTGDQAGSFGAQLDDLSVALKAEDRALESVIVDALASTNEMKESAAALQQQVLAGRHEIERLRDDLNRARDEATLDPLTRLLNRKGFDDALDRMLASPLTPGRAHCLVMLDIDRFKAVNDSYGHVMGDRVLQAVSEVLRNGVADPAHSVARYGGEEFAVLLPDCLPSAALALADSGRQRVGTLRVRDRRSTSVILKVTISAGLAAMQTGDDAFALIARADEALYAAKQGGRDRVVCDRAIDPAAAEGSSEGHRDRLDHRPAADDRQREK